MNSHVTTKILITQLIRSRTLIGPCLLDDVTEFAHCKCSSLCNPVEITDSFLEAAKCRKDDIVS
uniref:Apple domain-containing protein n=1 Tax=Heterorhabditis bacteriophora TaxID=37862 RepID=A0A1I7XKE1_HETBA